MESSTTRALGSVVPRAQHWNGVETGVCPIAPPARYLPKRVGCVSVVRANVAGDGPRDLVVVYSTLTREAATQAGLPARLKGMFVANHATLEVVSDRGRVMTVPLQTRVAAILGAAHVNASAGDEVFLDVQQVSSGMTVSAYGDEHGRLVPAGTELGSSQAGSSQVGFDCVGGRSPRLIERQFEVGSSVSDGWTETAVTYSWRGASLILTGRKVIRGPGAVPVGDTGVGAGCVA